MTNTLIFEDGILVPVEVRLLFLALLILYNNIVCFFQLGFLCTFFDTFVIIDIEIMLLINRIPYACDKTALLNRPPS